jgi:amidase
MNTEPEHNPSARIDPLGALRLLLSGIGHASAGPLWPLTFAVKDMFDVAGIITGGGTPDWLTTHAPARETAPAVAACLQAGARLTGIAIADELAFSITGQNFHYGTPLNPAAPDCVPGGSSSGSASATAGGLVDFALGTDTAGSIRVPASYCGIFGMRPTHGRLPMQGVMPLSPSFDTVGWFARDAATLQRVGTILLGDETGSGQPIRRLLLLEDAFDLAEPAARPALERAVQQLAGSIAPLDRATLSAEGYADWLACFNVLRPPEIWAAHGDWITQTRPRFGPQIAARLEAARQAAHADTTAAQAFRTTIQRQATALLGTETAFVLPTVPTIAPKRDAPDTATQALRERTFRLTCIAPLLGFPAISIPMATVDGRPIGLSLIAATSADQMLLSAARQLPLCCLSSGGLARNPDPLNI